MKTKLLRLTRKQKLIILACVILATTVLAVGFMRQTDRPVQAEVITYSTDNPDEEEPGEDYQWSGGPNDPKYISLSTINTAGFIQKVGVDQNKEVAVPNNIHLAGWFVDSRRPGEKGLSVIDGHVDGRSTGGIFRNLGNLKEDDVYTVEMGDGTVHRFRVKKVVSAHVDEAANVLFSQDPTIGSQLNLITCGGNFDTDTRRYDERVIVVSELI